MKIRERIVQELRDSFALITRAHGYATDLGTNVNIWTGKTLSTYKCPVCLIVDDGEDIIEENNEWHHDLRINVGIVLSEMTPDYRTKLVSYVDDIYTCVKELLGQDGHCYDLSCKGDTFDEETAATFIATNVIMMNAHYVTDRFSLR